MRVLLQRVRWARVTSKGSLLGEVDKGILALVGVADGDDEAAAVRLAGKLARLRIFADDAGKMNLCVGDVGGSVLVVSQFTLYADSRKGNRPSYVRAAPPEQARPLCERFAELIRSHGLRVETGEFGADMQIELLNDGPVTILLDSAEL